MASNTLGYFLLQKRPTYLGANFDEVSGDIENKVSDAAYESFHALTTTNLRNCVDVFDKRRYSRIRNAAEHLQKHENMATKDIKINKTTKIVNIFQYLY